MGDEWGATEAGENVAVVEDDGALVDVPDKKLFNKWALSDVQVSDISLQVGCC